MPEPGYHNRTLSDVAYEDLRIFGLELSLHTGKRISMSDSIIYAIEAGRKQIENPADSQAINVTPEASAALETLITEIASITGATLTPSNLILLGAYLIRHGGKPSTLEDITSLISGARS